MNFSRRSFLQLSSAVALSPLLPRTVSPATDPATAALCHKLVSDPLRPQYHLMPAHNWMNDPNVPIFFRGRYHMFHQYNPQAAIWGNMNWAHATSPDMIHWRHEPIAISPTPNGPDREGVFSGSAVLDRGKPTMIYTGVAPPASDAEATLRDGVHTWRETQCLAVAQDDDLRTWKKLPEPVITAPPPGLAVTGFRDPYVWREGNSWMLTLGAGLKNKGGMVLLYSSPDLRHWTYLHPLVEGSSNGKQSANAVDTGDMWECPDFFPLGNKHVLLISTQGKVLWKVGAYANQRFTPEKEGVVDWGAYYAAKTMLDRNGNRNSSPAARQKILDALRIHDLAAELDLELQPKSDEFTLQLQSANGTDFLTITCANKPGGRELRVNSVTAPLPGAAGSPIHLHPYLDGSVLEVFANGGTALTARVYQIPSGPLRLKLEGAEITSLDAWQLTPISKDRLTASLCS